MLVSVGNHCLDVTQFLVIAAREPDDPQVRGDAAQQPRHPARGVFDTYTSRLPETARTAANVSVAAVTARCLLASARQRLPLGECKFEKRLYQQKD